MEVLQITGEAVTPLPAPQKYNNFNTKTIIQKKTTWPQYFKERNHFRNVLYFCNIKKTKQICAMKVNRDKYILYNLLTNETNRQDFKKHWPEISKRKRHFSHQREKGDWRDFFIKKSK